MTIKNFFTLSGDFKKIDTEAFLKQLRISKHLCNILYEPTNLAEIKIEDTTFENVSFSKTAIVNVTFKGCAFKDCLFIGTHFESVGFHNCRFENCNFFKCKLQNIYAKPYQFRRAIQDENYSNIAVHLYQQLRENYYQESQREFRNEAEYFFGHWQRKNDYIQNLRNNKSRLLFLPQHILSWIYGYFLGYGFRLRNIIATSVSLFVVMFIANYNYSADFFVEATEPTIFKTLYFTLTTMATLGAAGYTPNTDLGYTFIMLNVVFGITIFTASIGAILNKVIK